ncbi:MAG: hypothetical protein RLZZ127_1903 [Planctomycetota bacterium]|jgi:peroxiredoxin
MLRTVPCLLLLVLAGCGGPRLVTQSWPDGQPRRSGTVERGQPTGAWTYHDREGRIEARGSYMMGKPHGDWVWYHPDGNPARTGSFTGGLRQGEWIRYHPGGVVAERGAYADDRQTGPWLWFHADGRPAGEGAFLDGVRHGPWRQWDVQGRLVADGRYERGLRVGPWRDGPDRVEDLGPAPATVAVAAVAGAAPTPIPVAEPPIAQQRPPAEPLPASSPVIPGFWTVAEDRVARTILARAAGHAVDTAGYDAPPPPPKAVSPLVGTMLPRTRFLAADGTVVDIAALNREGRSVVLVLQRGFSGQICIYCAAQTAALADALPRFRARNAEVVVVFPGPSETIPAFIAAVQTLRTDPPPMPVCLDVDLGLVRGLKVEDAIAKPTALVVSPAGRITYAHVGRDKTDRPSVQDLLDVLPSGGAR